MKRRRWLECFLVLAVVALMLAWLPPERPSPATPMADGETPAESEAEPGAVAMAPTTPRPTEASSWDAEAFIRRGFEQLRRLTPDAFPQLPKAVAGYLEGEGYTIPQCGAIEEPHNVIRGSFYRADQVDWAVMASQDRMQALLIFPDGGLPPEVLGEGPIGPFQGWHPEGTVLYSRVISTVPPSHRYLDGVGADHDGLDIPFFGKASSVLYHDGSEWTRLPGAD